MSGKHNALLAAVCLAVWLSPAQARDGAKPSVNVDNAGPLAGDGGVAEKKKGKGGKKGNQQEYMTIKLENTMITSYKGSQPQGPKGALGGGLLDGGPRGVSSTGASGRGPSVGGAGASAAGMGGGAGSIGGSPGRVR